MLAIAVSSEASASAVKIAATAQRRRSGGKPSMPGVAGGFAVKSPDILIGLSTAGADAPSWACTTDAGRATATLLHDAYAKALRKRRDRAAWRHESPAYAAFQPPTFGYLSGCGLID